MSTSRPARPKSAHPILLVTGGSRGIGAAVARRAAEEGYAVAVNYRGGQTDAEAVAEAARATGQPAIAVQGDTADPTAVTAMFERIDAELGPVTHLFNNAGVTGPIRRLVDLAPEDLAQVTAVNVNGCFLVAQAAVRRMSTAWGGVGGAIVNMSSRAGQLGGAGEWLHYAASKGAVDTFTEGLAREVGGEGIRVNAVSPGLIDTEIHARAGAPDRVERLLPGVPAGRVGRPDEVAATVLYLLSDAASYVSGAIVPVSGGR